MAGNPTKAWPISVGNGVLLACYFIPTWLFAVRSIIEAPIRGLFERPNIAVATFFGDHFALTQMGVARLAWMLALGRVLVVAFFAAFLVMALRAVFTRRDDTREPLMIALALGLLLSGLALIGAIAGGEAQALRLHATETLLLLGAVVVMLVEEEPQTAEALPSVPAEVTASATSPFGATSSLAAKSPFTAA